MERKTKGRLKIKELESNGHLVGFVDLQMLKVEVDGGDTGRPGDKREEINFVKFYFK